MMCSSKQFVVDGVRIGLGLHYELVEARRAFEEQRRSVLLEFAGGIVRFRQVVNRQLFQSFTTVDCHEDAAHQRNQCLIGADVRGRLLAADVLFASGKRQHEAALAIAVGGLSDQATGHLANEFFVGGYDAAVGASETERHAERLRFHADDVGLSGRLHDAQRDGFRDRDNQQCALLVDDVGDGGNVFDGAEEIGRLDEDAGGFESMAWSSASTSTRPFFR